MAGDAHQRPDPERLLRQAEAEERHGNQGKLKVFLGYAPGVGKTVRMFDEGRRRRARGEDVVVAAVQDKMAAEAEALLAQLEVIAPAGSGGVDVAAVLRRRPRVCLIDGLAHDNPPGSRNRHRWEDVAELLRAGVPVVTSVNIQYVQEVKARAAEIRGRSVEETVPGSFLRMADEIEVVDAPAEYCLPGQGGRDRQMERQLSELRELALLLAADVVDAQLEEYLQRSGIDHVYGTHERILVCVTPRSNADLMIRRGRRQADRFHGELHVLSVKQPELTEEDDQLLRRNLEMARRAGAVVAIVESEDAIGAIVRYAAAHGITQLFVGHTQQQRWWTQFRTTPLERLIVEAEGVDVRVFPNRERGHG